MPTASRVPQPGPAQAYAQSVAAGALRADVGQEAALAALQRLHEDLLRFGRRRLWGFSRPPLPRSLYLYGPVGRGKSSLMDLLVASTPVPVQRLHFHAFMLGVHAQLHEWRQHHPTEDPIGRFAAMVAGQARLLCLDEFHVRDIADAMILKRLLAALLDMGVVMVATSNWRPDELYANGLQRALFLPCITMIKERFTVIGLGMGRDWRLERIRQGHVFHQPLGPAATRALTESITILTEGMPLQPAEHPLQGRSLTVPQAARGVAVMNFDQLCRQPLGAADYMVLAQCYHTLVMDGIPQLNREMRNESIRFMMLVDALYDHRVKLIAALAVKPDQLYPEALQQTGFQRTVSRLMEMQSADWLALPHLP